MLQKLADFEVSMEEHKQKEIMFQEKIENLVKNLSSYENENGFLRSISEQNGQELEKMRNSNAHLEKELACQIQEIRLLRNENARILQNTNEAIEKANEAAKAAVFEVGSKLSNQLIEQNRREAEERHQTNQNLVEKTTENLNLKFENIVKSVNALDEKIKDSSKIVDVMKRTMLSPNSIGGMAEITLENILKASGLVQELDFFMQKSMNDAAENKLRPDCVVLLPSDNVIVIDSKASKFFFEMNFEGENEKELEMKLKGTMRGHLRSLNSKDYSAAASEHFVKNKTANVTTIMFLQSDSSLEKIIKIDPEFIYKAWEMNIFPTGPTGLISILSHAKFQISQLAQMENHHKIMLEIKQMLASFNVLYEHARKMGSSLKNTAQHYDKFAASFNGNFTRRVNNLENLGLENKKNIAAKLDRYQLITSQDLTIEHEENV